MSYSPYPFAEAHDEASKSQNNVPEIAERERDFRFCPLCGDEEMEVNIMPYGRDTVSCKGCGAKWHLYIGITGFRWAELETQPEDGTGAELLGKRIRKNDWRKMAEKARTHPRAQRIRKPPKGKETIVERVVMVSCSNCGGLMPKNSIFCPHCGARCGKV
jgi:hypothetical protein